MGNPGLGGRKCYKSSGRVGWARFVPLSLLPLAASAGLAVFLYFLFKWGEYYAIVVPLLAAAGSAGLVMLAVAKGHCRNRFVAGLLGATAGIILFLGSYYVGFLDVAGPTYATQPAAFMRYIRFRMATDTEHEVGAPERHGTRSGQPVMNWFRFGMEFLGVMVFTTGAGILRARKAYCETCGTWLKRESTTFVPEIGPGLTEALRISSAQSLAVLFRSPPKANTPFTAVAVEYCPNAAAGTKPPCPVYLSVKQAKTMRGGATADPFDRAKGKTLANRAELSPDELGGVLHRFTSLEKLAGTTAAQALEKLDVSIAPSSTPEVLADVKPVAAQYAGRILTRKNALIGAAIMFSVIAAMIGGIAIAAGGALLAFPEHPPVGGPSTILKVSGIVIIIIGCLIALAGTILGLTRIDYLPTRFLQRVTRREFGRRPGHLVNPADSTAEFVHVIPRANWGKLKLEDATDIGFLKVDGERGELLFEGDNEFYRIPGGAIASCEVETFIAGAGTEGAMTLFRVVVQTNVATGPLEIPFAQRGNNGKFRAKIRQRWAAELQQKILAIVPGPG